ncbi:MAG TPA: amino acid adenylation domain-containing protein [Ktedonobacteraceae bacterium]|nr:amino acid adenylation domain-containing protein [Ktedonobacteraceae bacterium]
MPNTPELSEARKALLAKYLRGEMPVKAKTVEKAIPQRTEGSLLPLSFGQQQLWLLSQLIADTPVYNECVTIYLPGALSIAALEQSLNEIIRRHEAWRTTFPLVNGQPVQQIHAYQPITLPLIDLSSIAEGEREAVCQAREMARQPFDLVNGPLLRPLLVYLSSTDHRLFLSMHHIIFDGFSLYQVLLPELYAIYEAFLSGKPSPLAELPYQYAEYALWQREWLQGAMLTERLSFWKQQLEGAPATLELPTDRPRPPIQTYRGAVCPFVLSQHLINGLKVLGAREGASLYMVLVAAFQTLLYRYTGQDDILVGTSTAAHRHKEFQGILGYFLNTVVLRTNLSGNPTFRELLRRVREVVLTTRDHEDVPFEFVVKELQPERNLGQNPLFQVLLTLVPPQSESPSGWSLTQMDVEMGAAKFDLYLELDERPDGLIGRFVYNTDLFDTSTIALMVEHWKRLLESIVADPAQHIEQLPLLSDQERHLLLKEWNETQAHEHKELSLHQIFETQVERAPDAIALVFEQEQLSYHELNTKANQLAHYLQRQGVGPDTLVGIGMERSPQMVIGLLGILKAGGAYVPLDPAYPVERLAFMLNDAQAQVLLTEQKLLSNLPGYAGNTICLDSDWKKIAQECGENPHSNVTAANLAYVIYTSGSTGKPKGVLVTHENVVRLFEATDASYHFEQGDVWTMFHSYAFDFSVWELWGALLYGARLVLVSYLVSRSPEEFYHLLCRENVTVLNQTPSAFYQLIWAEDALDATQTLALRLVIFGGEALEFQKLRPWFERHGDQTPTLVNMYGITETTVHVTYHRLTLADLATPTKSVIGRPISDLQVYILDQQQPVPIGVAGEMYVGGAGLARGYLHRPELSAQRFVLHPFSQQPGARLYRTGDLARFRPDGMIEYLGRIDQQIKIRGFRIELGEIEAALNQHPAIQQSVVTVRAQSLVAYIVSEQPTTSEQEATPDEPSPLSHQDALSSTELRRFLQTRLPEYMIPATFVQLATLPLTTNGKIDRRALPAPSSSKLTTQTSFVAPTLPLHHQLVQIWEELLGIQPIGIRDHFFDLGGHSLLAALMLNRIEQFCGKKLPLASLFTEPTIEHLTNILMEKEEVASHAPQINARTPLIAMQVDGSRRPFFFLHGDAKGGAFYCRQMARHLGPQQPFYILEPYEFDGLRTPPTFEEMATAHLEVMRKIQPQGPYQLGGWCNGALLAYEMARQLLAQDQEVNLLVLMDPGTTLSMMEPGIVTLHMQGRQAIRTIGKLLHIGQDKQLGWFLRLRHIYRYLRYPQLRKARDAAESQGLFPAIATLRQDWGTLYDWIAWRYRPRGYPGKLTIFWDSEDLYRRTAWQNVDKTNEVETHIIPGDHITARTEYLSDLAECLRHCLDDVQ